MHRVRFWNRMTPHVFENVQDFVFSHQRHGQRLVPIQTLPSFPLSVYMYPTLSSVCTRTQSTCSTRTHLTLESGLAARHILHEGVKWMWIRRLLRIDVRSSPSKMHEAHACHSDSSRYISCHPTVPLCASVNGSRWYGPYFSAIFFGCTVRGQ